MKILVICPTQAEYLNFGQSLRWYMDKNHVDRPDIMFQYTNSGMGKVNAAAVTALEASNSKADLIVVIGYAAGDLHFDRGDVVCPNRARYHDVRVPEGFVPDLEMTYDLVGDDDCTIMTGDSFVDELMIDNIVNHERDQRHLFDMESAAVAQVGCHMKIPVLVVKMVSDLPQKLDNKESYEEFVRTHFDFTSVIEKIHNYIISK